MTAQEVTVGALLAQAHGRGLAPLDAQVLIALALGRPRSWLRAWPEYRCTEAQATACEALLSRRAQGEPVAYITGEREFWSLSLRVDSHTLIPRADTELLVERALALGPALPPPEHPNVHPRVLDLGTGTGAIALALAREAPQWEITATDVSPAALRLAAVNAQRLGLSPRLCEGSWWNAVPAGETFDLVVSNPPYLRADDPHLHRGDVRFEPRTALTSGADGLDAIRTIASGGRTRLNAGGWLLLEHGFEQGQAVRALLRQAGYADVSTHRDLAGHERATQGRAVGPLTD